MVEDLTQKTLEWARDHSLFLQRAAAPDRNGLPAFIMACVHAKMLENDEAGWRRFFEWKRAEGYSDDYFDGEEPPVEHSSQYLNDSIDMLAQALSNGEYLMQVLSKVAKWLPRAAKIIGTPPWQADAALFNFLHLIFEHLGSQLVYTLPPLLNMIAGGLVGFESHPCKRMAAAICFGQLAEEMSDQMSPYIVEIVRVGANSILNDPSLEVVEVLRDVILAYLTLDSFHDHPAAVAIAETLVPNALETVRSRHGDWPLSLIFLGGLSEGMRESFTKYYPETMTLINQIFLNHAAESQLVLNRALSASSVIIRGAFKYSKDDKLIEGRLLEDARLVATYAQSSGAAAAGRPAMVSMIRLASVLGEDARSIVAFSIPPLLEILMRPPLIRLDAPENAPTSSEWTHVELEDRVVSVNRTDFNKRTVC